MVGTEMALVQKYTQTQSSASQTTERSYQKSKDDCFRDF